MDTTGRHGPTRDQARGPRWRRLGGGWYVAADAPQDLAAQRVVEAAVHLPQRGAVSGWASLDWQGARFFEGVDGLKRLRAVPLVVGAHNLRPRDGVLVSKEWVLASELHVVDGLRVTSPAWSTLFEMRHASSLRVAVRHADAALASDLVSLDELRACVTAQLYVRKGVGLARQAVDLADENCWSPAESDMRDVWTTDAGLPRPLCNRPVFDLHGRRLFTPDLIDPVLGLVGEYDSAEFHPGARRARDLERDDLMRRTGLEPVVMVASDRHDPGAFVARLLSAHARIAARPPGPRLWTLDPPPWWIETHTVAQRRSLTPAQRARIYRRQADSSTHQGGPAAA